MLPKHGHYFPQASTTGIFNSLSWVACSTFEACFDALPEKRLTAEAIPLTPTASSAKPSPCVSPPPDKGGAEIVALRDVETVTEHVRDAAANAVVTAVVHAIAEAAEGAADGPFKKRSSSSV
jgi:hypothetical protein